jgi:monofunctional biosynthetic peptidoglycan transglycosylase
LPRKVTASLSKYGVSPGQVFLSLPAIAFGVLAYGYLTLPDVRPLAKSAPVSTAFMDLRAREAVAQGKKPRRLQTWVSYSRISPELRRAVLVAEDAAFFEHDGVDYDELQKSIEANWESGEFLRGASTITQQLAKNLYLSPSKNPLRKLRELVIARRLEAELPKLRILEIYLNVIEWGDGIYGIEAAARNYFGSSAASLDATRSALLAGAIINPRVLTPAKPTPRLLRRQQIILRRMHVGSRARPERVTTPAAPRTAPAQPPSPEAFDSAPVEVPSVLPSAREELSTGDTAAEPK